MDFLKVKRNQAIIILGIAQALKGFGIDIKISEVEIDAILSGGAIVWGIIGVIHDAIRKIASAKKSKKVQ